MSNLRSLILKALSVEVKTIVHANAVVALRTAMGSPTLYLEVEQGGLALLVECAPEGLRYHYESAVGLTDPVFKEYTDPDLVEVVLAEARRTFGK